MSARPLFIYGCGGHAKVVAATARLCGYDILGFWEDSEEHIGEEFFGSRIVAFQTIPAGASIFIAFGNNRLRLIKGKKLKETFVIPSIVHPSAQIAEGVIIGCGSYVGALANLDPDCAVGDFCIVNNGANISHETILHDGCHVCGGGQIAGQCSVGECSMMGIGSCMIENCHVGANSCVGAGATVVRDIPDHVTAVGTPARIIKKYQS